MSNELKYLSNRVARGLMDRRAFMGRAAALGVGTTAASSLISTAALGSRPDQRRHN